MSEANKNPVTPSEGSPPSSLEIDLKHALRCLRSYEEDALSMCTTERSFVDWVAGIPHHESGPMANRNKDSADYRMLSQVVRRMVGQGRKLGLLMELMELLLIAKLRNMERDVHSLKEENATLREERSKDRELIQGVRKEMVLKERELEIEGRKLREVHKREIECFQSGEERLREDIEEERELSRKVKKEMELKEREMEAEGVKLREAHEQDMLGAMRENEAVWEEAERERELTRKVMKEMELKETKMQIERIKLLEEHELDMQGPLRETEALRQEIKEIRKLSSKIEAEMDDKVGQMRIKEGGLPEAQEQEVRHLKRENEMLRKEIEKERQLIREDVRREMELKAHEIGIKERTLREAQELGERVKTDADSLVARD